MADARDYMFQRLVAMDRRKEEIDNLLAASDIDSRRRIELSKEAASIEEPVLLYHEYLKMVEEREAASDMAQDNDPELSALGREELQRLNDLILSQEEKLQTALLPKDLDDDKNVIMEIKGAVGGEEACLFAADLYRMYMRYAENHRWRAEIMDESPTTLGGYSSVTVLIKGKKAYSRLKFESGAHRVQRVPVTESSGRIHTSTATVLVMPEQQEVDVEINPADLTIETYRSSGAGGQNVNKTESAVRIIHHPSGIVVTCQVERSQLQNKALAMNLLRTRLKAKMDEERSERIGSERRLKVGTGDRSEKIRTYNYPQNRVTDHRIGYTVQRLDRIIEGDLDELFDALQAANQKDLMLEQIKRAEQGDNQ